MLECHSHRELAVARKGAFTIFKQSDYRRAHWVKGLLGGSWVVISGIIRPLIWIITITIATLLIIPLRTAHKPPSRVRHFEGVNAFKP